MVSTKIEIYDTLQVKLFLNKKF